MPMRPPWPPPRRPSSTRRKRPTGRRPPPRRPTRGPSAGEGAQVLRAVKAVVDRANYAGGVAGRRVELVAVPTDDAAARADALGRVEALVGGFAIDAPAGMPWIMPADVAPAGPDVTATELAAEQAGAALGSDLSARSSDTRTVGAIVAPGPDAGLAAGLAKTVAVQQVEAGTDTTCDQEMLALRKRDVAALALAVPPDLARRCAAAAARIANGALTLSAVRDRHWHSDLYDVDAGRHTTSHIVTIRFGRWANAPTRSGPPSRRGVVNPLNPIVAFSSDN